MYTQSVAINSVFFFIISLLSTGFTLAADFEPKPASPATLRLNQEVLANLPKDNGEDAEFASRGFIASVPNPKLLDDHGDVVFDASALDWIDGEVPATVNPSLWRHMKLLRQHGLYRVADGIWQIRGLDTANMTIVEGKTGWILIDVMMNEETSKQAMQLVSDHLGKRPVSAVMYSHSHVDHFGGVRGVLSDDVSIPIFAPVEFVEETISEFVVVGNVMLRRGGAQSGKGVPRGPQGFAGVGILSSTSDGTVTLVKPTQNITTTGETHTIDGVRVEFHMAMESEAPSEFNLYLPEKKTLYVSEITSCTMHNLQTPRGAKARDALRWSGYLTELINRYGSEVETLTTGNCWPRFGNEAVTRHLRLQRDNYKYIHDQTVRLINLGYTPLEIAEMLTLPDAIAQDWSTNGYYGTYRHNAKGVFQYYVGWWDGIPANLNRHPPVEQGIRYVKAMGGVENVIRVARDAMKEGDYRWSAELLNHLVFARPKLAEGRALLADSYEQLAYQAESAIWRNDYLKGAAELRHGIQAWQGFSKGGDMLRVMDASAMFTMLATQLDPKKVDGKTYAFTVEVLDTNESWLLTIENSVLVHQPAGVAVEVDARVSGGLGLLKALFLTKKPVEALLEIGLDITGNQSDLQNFISSTLIPVPDFPVVTP